MQTCLYITDDKVQVVVGEPKKDKISISTAIEQEIREGLISDGRVMNDVEFCELIEEIWEKNKFSKKDVSLIFNSREVLLKIANVPIIKEEKVIEYSFNEFTDVENSAAFLCDYAVIEPRNEEDGATVLCSAVERDFVEQYVALFTKMKIQLKSIDIGVNSLMRLAKMHSDMKEKTVVISALEKKYINHLFLINGMYIFSTRSQLFDERGSDESATEISRSLFPLIQLGITDDRTEGVDTVYMANLQDNEGRIPAIASGMLGVDVKFVQNDNAVFEYTGADGFDISRFVYPVGNLCETTPAIKGKALKQKEINYYKRYIDTTPRQQFLKKWIPRVLPYVIVTGGLVLAYLTVQANIIATNLAINPIKEYLADKNVEAQYQEAQKLVAYYNQRKAIFDTIDDFNANIDSYPRDIVECINTVYSLTNNEIYIIRFNYSEDSGLMTFVCRAMAEKEDSLDPSAFVDRIRQSEAFNALGYVGYNINDDAGYEFSVTCQLKTPVVEEEPAESQEP